MKRQKLLLLVLTSLVLGMAGCESREAIAQRETAAARERGAEAARADITAGLLKQKEYPPLPYSKQQIEFLKLLRSECGVTNEVVSGPTESAAMRQEVAAYNDVMGAEIRRRFGADIFQKLHEKAEAK
jgi:hypothetical protein